MFSAKNNFRSLWLFLLAVIFIAAGMTLSRSYGETLSGTDNDHGPGIGATGSTHDSDVGDEDIRRIPDNDTDSSVTVSPETAGHNGAAESAQINGSDVYPESEDAYTVSESDGSPVVSDGQASEYRTVIFCGYAASIVGVLLGIFAVFIDPVGSPVLSSEPDVMLFVLAFYVFAFDFPGNPILSSALYAAAAAALLAGLRELYAWMRAGCPVTWCLPYRISSYRSDGAALIRRAPAVHAIFCTAEAATAIALLITGVSVPLAVILALSAVLAAYSLHTVSVSASHLCRQIDAAADDSDVDVRPGAFEAEERKLSSLRESKQKAVDDAVASERFRVDLISNVSHDLRTPLTSILGYGEILRREPLTDEGRERLERLNLKAGYMKDLVESLFELTKVSSGVIEAKREGIDLIRLLEQTIGLFDDQLRAASLTVRRHYGSDTLPIVSDGARLHQVFANLLGNAIKYSLHGTRIHIEIKHLETECRVRIVNTASYEMDFSPEEITHRFVTGDKSRTSGGSGIGLAIAETYTESVGGRFYVTVDGDQFAAVVTLPTDGSM